MREKIRILEGIWGDDSGGDEPGTAGASGHKGQRQTGGTAGEPDTTASEEEGDGRGRTHSADAAAVAATGLREGGPEGERSQPSGSRGSRGDRGSDGDGSGPVSGDGGGGGDLGGSTADAGVEGGGEAEETGGRGEGDAGVDAWLISYNRRLKKELERLRERTRQAEDRCVT